MLRVASSGCAAKNLVASWRALVASWEASALLTPVMPRDRTNPAISWNEKRRGCEHSWLLLLSLAP